MSDFAMHVVIPTHGRPETLRRTLSSLESCELPRGFAGVTVVENGGREGAQRVVEELSERLRPRYLWSERPNKSEALNVALAEGGLEGLLVFLDDDVRVETELLVAYDAAASHKGAGYFFGGPTGVDYEVKPERYLSRFLPESAVGWTLGDEPREWRRPTFLGFNWAAWTDDVDALGGFSPRRGPGSGSVGQEQDMQERLLAEGRVGWYAPRAKVWHWVPEHRCTEAWLLDRAHKLGVREGRRFREGEPGVAARARHRAYWAVHQRLNRARRAASVDPAERFRARYFEAVCRGRLAGARGE